MINDITFLHKHLKPINVKLTKQQSCVQSHKAQDTSSVRSLSAFCSISISFSILQRNIIFFSDLKEMNTK